MDWIEDVRNRLKRKNQILFSKGSEYLQDLLLLIETQNRRTTVLWAFDLAEETVKRLEEKYPSENRPRSALEASKIWATGKIKMPIAKREILNCHAFAKEITIPEDIALCHAVAQACSVVHANGHALGFPIYDLTSIVYGYGINHCKEAVEKRKQDYIEKMLYWEKHYRDYSFKWAEFLLR